MADANLSRRATLSALAGSLTALAGCSTVLGSSGSAVRVLCAGSLQNALLALDSAVDPAVQVEAHGSAAAARMVADGQRHPDVVALADATLFESVLSVPWYAHVATNELTLAYDASTDAGRRIERAERWVDPIADGSVSLGRTDPALDPLGYRTLFALELAETYYDRPGLAASVRESSRIYPETSLLARLDSGAVGAAVVYRNMAQDHGFDTVDLPAAIDLSDPERADSYRTTEYTLPDGTTVTGGPIDYAATARNTDDDTLAVFETIIDGALLADYGFRVTDRYPSFEGDVPDKIPR